MAGNVEPEVLKENLAQPLIVPGFLEPAACRRIRDAMDAGASEPAEVLAGDIYTDERVRRAALVEVDAGTLAFVESLLDSARDRVGRFFGVRLTDREGAGFLRYPPGGLFKSHRDTGHVPSWPDAARRQISVVVFLTTSRRAHPSGAFSGGSLWLHAPDGTPAVELPPRAGTLVAFPAAQLHEVETVRDGIRDSIVDWYY